MDQFADIDRFVRDPSLLVKLCSDVTDRLAIPEDGKEIIAMEAQLREISKTIEKLERMQVEVPESLRAEKTKIAAALGMKADVSRTLIQLIRDLEEITETLRAKLESNRPNSGQRGKGKRSRSPKTHRDTLRKHIVTALQKLGGSGRVREVLDEMEKQLKGTLLPGDMEWRDQVRMYTWQHNACWERLHMVKDGMLKSNSPHGVWELSKGER